jgi:DNA-binding protein H-NS
MKNELVKQAIMKKMESQQGMKDFKAKEDYKQKLKANDPGQMFLRNRMTQENPLDQMKLPESPDDAVEFPADTVETTPTGKLTTKETSGVDKNKWFINLVEKRRAAGQVIPEQTEKIIAKMKGVMPASHGYKQAPKEVEVSAATKKALAGLADYKTQQEALDEVESNQEAYELADVDTEYVKKRIKEILPLRYNPGSAGNWLGRGKKPAWKTKADGTSYVKSGGKWHLMPEDKEDAE